MIKVLISCLILCVSSLAYSADHSCDAVLKSANQKLSDAGLVLRGQAKLPFPGLALVYTNKLKSNIAVLLFTPLDLTGKWPKQSNPKTVGTCTAPNGQTINVYIDRPKIKQTEASMRT